MNCAGNTRSSADDNHRQITRYQKNIKTARKRLAQLQAALPKKPVDGEPGALKEYEVKIQAYKSRR